MYLAGLAFTLGSALLFGMVPARQAWQSSPLQTMKSGPVESLHLRRFALRDLLLGAQIAICTLLVTASLVAVRGMVRALHAPLGIQPQGAMLVDMDLSQVRTGRRRGARETESDPRGGAEHPRCDGGGYGEPHAHDRRDAWRSDLPAGDDRVQAEQFRAGAVRVSDVAGIPGGCRHPAAERARCLLARHRKDALCGHREPNLRAQDVGPNAGRSDSTLFCGAT